MKRIAIGGFMVLAFFIVLVAVNSGSGAKDVTTKTGIRANTDCAPKALNAMDDMNVKASRAKILWAVCRDGGVRVAGLRAFDGREMEWRSSQGTIDLIRMLTAGR